MLNQTARAQAGREGEEAAARFLEEKGAQILHRNWRAGHLELDLVCLLDDHLVFVEVKTRDASGMTAPWEALGGIKKRRLVRAAHLYLASFSQWDRPCRFDLVCVQRDGNVCALEHYTDVFTLSDALGRGNTAWQPW